jgi:hypothetical protein
VQIILDTCQQRPDVLAWEGGTWRGPSKLIGHHPAQPGRVNIDVSPCWPEQELAPVDCRAVPAALPPAGPRAGDELNTGQAAARWSPGPEGCRNLARDSQLPAGQAVEASLETPCCTH